MNSAGHIKASGQAKVHIGDNYSIDVSTDLNRNRCLADLRLADPREEKARIEQTKGGRFRDSYEWILDNDEFRRWQHEKRSCVLWIKGDAGKGKTMLLCGIINELSQSAPNSKTGKEKKRKTGIINKLSHSLKGKSASSRPKAFVAP
ncbi:hypothetical protein B0T24DRAFT_156142 [Lasiosphaeria ovina]|uniref:Nephrocystin 3-like N-terminal domain-containing protein n=1 Tax=Lasiosphaeria ovina TaxID=92902 RepID=A0AAE0KNY5_9PEZI|nr:hypothetical protein B0T24DRAFT_156142 [Lasiosphaeria ovina]